MDFISQLFSGVGEPGVDQSTTETASNSSKATAKNTDKTVETSCLADESEEEVLDQQQERSSLRQRKRQKSIPTRESTAGHSSKIMLSNSQLNSKRKILKDLDEDDNSSIVPTSTTVLDEESLKLIEDSTKALVRQEFDKHHSMNAMFQLHSDTYSFLLTCKFQSFMFITAFLVFCLQMTLYGLAFASATDFTSSSNPLQIPAGVEVSVTAAQFLALGIAVIVQDSLRESLFLVENYRVILDNVPGITQTKLLICFVMKLSESVLSLVLILVLICQKDDVVELLMDFAALLFVSSLDNIIFRIGREGYLGKHFRSAIDNVRGIRFYTSGRKKLKIILRTTVVVIVYISLLVSWIIICPVRQGNGYYLPDKALVQFPGGSSDATLSFFTGVYKLDKRRVSDRRIMYVEDSGASRFHTSESYRRRVQQRGAGDLGRFPAYFAYCNGLTAWVFVAASTDEDHSPCSDYRAVSSKYLGYSLLETADLPWYINNNANEPINDFFLQELSYTSSSPINEKRLYGLRQEFDQPCPNLQLDELKGQLVGTRQFASTYEILRNSDGGAVEVYTRPVYINNDSSDIIFYTGSVWVLTGLSFIWDYATGRNLTTYFTEEFHAYWSNYDSFLVTEIIGFSSEKDAATPVGLNWFVFNQQTREADPTLPVDATLLCAVCDKVKNPCFYQGECQSDGSCECTTGSSGVLCQVPPISDGKCDSFFNSLAFNWDGGDCCKSTCKSNGKQNCGQDHSRVFPVDFLQCNNPDLYKCSTTSSDNLCWVTGGGSLFGESNNAESGYSVAATESVLVVGEPGASSVRVFDRFGSEFFFRDILPSSLPSGSRFGTTVSISSSKNVYASATRLTKPVVAATSSTGDLKVFDWSHEDGVWLNISPEFAAWEDGDPELLSVKLYKEGSFLASFESDSLRSTGRVTIWEYDTTFTWVQKANITCHCSDFSLSGDASILVASQSNSSLASLYMLNQEIGNYKEHSFVNLYGPAKTIKLSETGDVMATLGFTGGDENKKEVCVFDRSNSNSTTLYSPRLESCYRLHDISSQMKDSIEMNDDGSFLSLVIKERRSITSFKMMNGSWRKFDETISGFSAVLFEESELIVGSPSDDSAGSNRGSVAVFAREPTFCQTEEVLVGVSIHFDAFPNETWFQVLDQQTKSAVMQHGPFKSADAFLTSKRSICVKKDQCLALYIYDTRGNGIAPPGQYSVHIDGAMILQQEFIGGLLKMAAIGPRNVCMPSLFDPPTFVSAELLQRCGNVTCDWLESGGDILGNSNHDMLGMVTRLTSDGQIVLASATEANQVDFIPVQGSASRGSVHAFMQMEGGRWEQLGNSIVGESATASLGAIMDAALNASAFAVLSERNGHVYHLENHSWVPKGKAIHDSHLSGYWDVSISDDGNTVAFVDANDGSIINSDVDGIPWIVEVQIFVWDGNLSEWKQKETINDFSNGLCEPVSRGFVLVGSGGNFAISCWTSMVYVYEYDKNQQQFRQMGQHIFDQDVSQVRLEGYTDRVGRPLALSSDGKTLATSFSSHSTKVWMYNKGSWVQKGNTILVGGEVSLGANGNIIAIGSPTGSDGKGILEVFQFVEPIKLWTLLGNEKTGEAQGQLGSSLSVADNGLRLAAGDRHFEATGGNPKVGRVQVFDLLPILTPGIERSCGAALVQLEVQITTDDFPEDSSYDILDFKAELLASSSLDSALPNEKIIQYHCLDLNFLPRFNMHDSYGNGLCCRYGNGSVKLLLGGEVFHEGGIFDHLDSVCLHQNSTLVDIRLLADWSDARTENLVVLHPNGSSFELWSKKDSVGDVLHQSCSPAACLVYGLSADYDSRFLSSKLLEVSFNQSFLETETVNGIAHAGAAEGLEQFFWYYDVSWIGQCKKSLCTGNRSIFQITLREDCSYRSFRDIYDDAPQCTCSQNNAQTNFWRLSNFEQEVIWGLNSSTPLPMSHFWACAHLHECLTFAWDYTMASAGHSYDERYLHHQDASFSLWHDEERFVNVINDRLRFPKVYQHGDCSARQCGAGFALFHLDATTGQNPSTVWSIHGSDGAAIVTHGFTKSDFNSTYEYRACLLVDESYAFVSVLGTGVEIEASWDGKSLDLKDGGVHFGSHTGNCERGMLHLTANIWFPRSILFHDCGVVCDEGYFLLDFHATSVNLTSLSWSIFRGSSEKALWTQNISVLDEYAELEHMFCLPDTESYFLFLSGETLENETGVIEDYTVNWNGSPVEVETGLNFS